MQIMKARILTLLILIFCINSCTSVYDYTPTEKYEYIEEGLSKKQVLDMLGEPEEIDHFSSKSGRSEIWVYYYDYLTPASCGSGCERYYYAPIYVLVFDENRLSSIFKVQDE